MALTATTPAAIRAVLVDAIQAMTPKFAGLRASAPWEYVRDVRSVRGAALRKFAVIHSVAELCRCDSAPEGPDPIHEDPLWGDGIEYAYEMAILVSYRAVGLNLELEEMMWQDGRDLWLLLHPQPGNPEIDGFIGARALSPDLIPSEEADTNEDGDQKNDDDALVVAFRFEMHFLAEDA